MWEDRIEAGQELGRALAGYRGDKTVVYGLPRGGVVVAAEVARFLNAPLDLIIARKIGHPSSPEYAVAAVTQSGEMVANESEISLLSKAWLERAVKEQQAEAVRRRKLYLGKRQHISANGKTAILVDDGIATGLTLQAAIKQLKAEKPAKLIVAVPVAPDDTASEIELEVDKLVCLHREKGYFAAVGSFFQRFEQTEDQDVINILEEAE